MRHTYYVFAWRPLRLIAARISKTGAVVRTHHNRGQFYVCARNLEDMEKLDSGKIPRGMIRCSAAPDKG